MTRPLVVLALLLAQLAVGFGLRTYLHRRRTGSTGFRGISGPPLSAAWLGGVGFVLALGAGLAAPIAALAGLDPPRPIPRALDPIGLAGFVAGNLLLLGSQRAMGASWRIGVGAGERTALITGGPFAWVRNPVFTGLILSAAGVTLLLPNLTALAGLAALIAAIELQVRAVEEPHLVRAHGRVYLDYAARVGRFVPRVGRMR